MKNSRCKQIDPDVGAMYIIYYKRLLVGLAVLVNRKEIAVGQRINFIKNKQRNEYI